MNRRQKIIVSVVGIFIVLLALVGLTYGYFLTRIQGNTNTTSITVTTADLKLTYGDGNEDIESASVLIPGEDFKFIGRDAQGNILTDTNGDIIEYDSKTFSVTNTGNTTVEDYAVVLEDVSVTYASNATLEDGTTVTAGQSTKFVRPQDFVYILTCSSSDGNDCNGQTEKVLPMRDSILIKNTITKDVTHNYELKIKYLDPNVDQSKDMNKTYQAKINIKDVSQERIVTAMAHRGYSVIAPENTLAAYSLAKDKGFDAVEADVQFTLDGVPVMLHDNTIDRTSNGTGAIAEMTFDEVRQYDFGSKKTTAVYGAAQPPAEYDFRGEKIPSFEEFIALCKDLDLYAYIELKNNLTWTNEKVQTLIDIVDQYDMQNNVAWSSFNFDALTIVRNLNEYAHIGYIIDTKITASIVSQTTSLRTGKNVVYLGNTYGYVDDTGIELCKSASLPLVVGVLNNRNDIAALDPYISGVTTDLLNVNDVLRDNKDLGTTSEYSVIKQISSDELLYKKTFAGSSPYIQTKNDRAIYAEYDISVVGGCTYKFEFTSTSPNAQIGVHLIKEMGMIRMEQDAWLDASNILDSNWQNSGFEIDVPSEGNTAYTHLRLIFRMDESNTPVEEGFITGVTVSRKLTE